MRELFSLKKIRLDTNLYKHISTLFESWAGQSIQNLEALPASGSDRQYFRVSSGQKQALVAYNTSPKENVAFIDYTAHFRGKGVALPEIYAQDLEHHLYLLQDLGDTTLLQFLEKERQGEEVPESVVAHYQKALSALAFMQIKGIEGLDISNYHNPDSFNEQAMLWDLQYFKYCYLKTQKIEFDEQLLEQDFGRLTQYLADDLPTFFMFRDFQARNIMLQDDRLYFIDYQGGKKGPLQYDVVSLLFQAKANLGADLREQLLDYYIAEASKYTSIDAKEFKDKFYLFALLRTLQVLGAYGFKGLYERKEHFIASIPFALKNLSWLLQNINFPISLEYLRKVLSTLLEKTTVTRPPVQKADQLTVRIQSFSYKRGIPEDPSGNGGGFVFDCRFIHNPGRYAPYKKLTGRDEAVIDFFKQESTIEHFVEKVAGIVDEAVENYIDRGFANLCINFGCTGGQHRSVFSADYIANHLKNKYPIRVLLHHREQERKNWKN